MRLFYRMLLTSFLVFCFLVTAPALLLYTSGYRFDFQQYSIIETGLISIQSYPKSANIFIDDNDIQKKTPFKMLGLLPKTYKVTVSKDAYFPWTKDLPVYPGRATIVDYITLFLKDQTPKALIQGSQKILFNNGEKILYVEQKEKKFQLREYDILNETNILVQEFLEQPGVRISPEGDIIITENKAHQISLFFRDTPENILNLSQEFNSNKKRLQLADIYFYDTRTIYVLFDGIVYSYDLRYGNTQPLTEHINNSYIAHDRSILYLSQGNQESFIMKKELKTQSQPAILVRIPKTNKISWGQSAQDTAILLDEQHDIMYVVDVRLGQVRPILDIFFGAHQGVWDASSTRLLYASTYELWTWDKDTESRSFLARFESPIKQITWIKGTNYVAVATDTGISILETQTTHGINIYPLINTSSITSLHSAEDGKSLIYRTEKKGIQSTFQITIQ